MRLLIQRVKQASVTIDGNLKSKIGQGMLVLVGIEDRDNDNDIEWLSNKLVNLRIFNDADGVMNRSILDVDAADIFSTVMSDIFKIKYAQVFQVNSVKSLEDKDKRVQSFLS